MDNNGAWPCLPSLYILWLRWGLWSGPLRWQLAWEAQTGGAFPLLGLAREPGLLCPCLPSPTIARVERSPGALFLAAIMGRAPQES